MAAKLAFIAGKSFRFEELSFYAMNGAVCVVDERDGDFKVVTRREWLHRTKSIGEEAAALKSSPKRSDYERRATLLRVYDDMLAAANEARDQGDHDDPIVSAWFRRHRPWARSSARLGSHLNFSDGAPGRLTRAGVIGGEHRPSKTKQKSRTSRQRLILLD